VLEDGRRWGEAAFDWQWVDARAVLDQGSQTPYHFLTRGRGSSKTADLAGIAVAAMLDQAPAGSRLYGLAADRDQGRLLLDSIQGYAARTPMLQGALDVQTYRAVAVRTGTMLEVLAADAPGAWGLRPWLVIVDELAQWPSTPSVRNLWEAVTSAVAKRADARLAVLTSAGDPAHWSAKVLEHARADPLWRVHEVPGPAPWLDVARLEEQRRRLPESSYRRLFLNEWTSAEDRLASVDDLRACVVLDGPLAAQERFRYAIGLDVGLKRDRTVAVVAHPEPLHGGASGGPPSEPECVVEDFTVHSSGLRTWTRRRKDRPPGQEAPVTGHRIVLDRIEVWQGSRLLPVRLQEVEDWIAQASLSYGRARLVFDPYQAVGLAQRLRARGVQAEEFTFSQSSVGRLASTLHLLIRNRALALPGDEELLDELANIRLRETSPGVVRLDHDPDRHDDRAVALALVAQHLLQRPTPGRARRVPGPFR
jgi:phage terminase large subunit-like protein